MKHQNKRINYTPEPETRAPYKTGFYEYLAGAVLGAILAVLLLNAFGVLFVPV
jgi:hypothetical protein